MSWNSNQWSGGYWGAKGRRASAKNQNAATGKGASKSKDAKKAGEKAFPKYDAMPVDGSGSLSSSSRSTPTEDAMQKAMISLIKHNPSLKVPKEISDVLEGASEAMTVEARNEIYEQQRTLNRRRKASQRADRLRDALKRKQLQFVAYQEQIKLQLKAEMERYTREKKELEDQLKDAKIFLEKLENGEDPAEEEPAHMVDVTDNTLAEMLGIASAGPSSQMETEMEQLKQDKMYAEMKAQHLQEQLVLAMSQSVKIQDLDPAMQAILKANGEKRSPQLPLLGAKKLKGTPTDTVVLDSPDLKGLTELDGWWSIISCKRIVFGAIGTGAQVHLLICSASQQTAASTMVIFWLADVPIPCKFNS